MKTKQLAHERLQKQRASFWDGIEFERAGNEAAVLQSLCLKSKLPCAAKLGDASEILIVSSAWG